MTKELVQQTDYRKEVEIFVKPVSEMIGGLKLPLKKEKIKTRLTFELKERRAKSLFNDFVHADEKNYVFPLYMVWLEDLCRILKGLNKTKPKFLAKHILFIEYAYYASGYGRHDKTNKKHFLKIDEVLWSYLKQTTDLKPGFLDFLFSETEENKIRKKEEVNELLDKTINFEGFNKKDFEKNMGGYQKKKDLNIR